MRMSAIKVRSVIFSIMLLLMTTIVIYSNQDIFAETTVNENSQNLINQDFEEANQCDSNSFCKNEPKNIVCDEPVCIISFKEEPYSLILPQ